MINIGEIRKILTPYYDKVSHSTKFKSRPGLIIGDKNGYDNDYLVLPVSRIKQPQYIDPMYDILFITSVYPLLNLTSDSYVRTGKVTTINSTNISDKISDMKSDYPEAFIDIMAKYEAFCKNTINNSLL